ncbi:hypothetical protein D0T12_30140 [Actinomadura spongiicola]|uniref:Transcriptional regulator SbtR-like C-terminal domain-containing protein n=1 Tax=Actinomadura spongiicola TaxID=2303421 RepID=A0A372G983_9ACTN|nr:hypothetical protein [Actinomadura spongiicola]RFS81964.1 hypothetical protein D0T12_30140 [Actinomadura spongiicola]
MARAERLSEAPDPLDALAEWTRQAVRHFSTLRGLVGILARSMYDEGTPSHEMCGAMHESGATLLRTAPKAGRVRAALSPDELFDLLTGVGWVRENSPADRDRSDRLLKLILEGLATGSDV